MTIEAVVTINMIVHGDYSHIERALRTLFDNTFLPMDVYVTINTGDSPELERLRSQFGEVNYIVNEQPKGFAANHNAVMCLAQSPYIALLNDDVEVSPAMLDKLIAYLESAPEVGLVSPLVLNPDGTPQLTAFSDPSLFRMIYKISGLGHLTRQGSRIRNVLVKSGIAHRLGVASLDNRPATRQVPVVVGVAMIVRREVYEAAGGMDEDTLVYGEEVSWHWRIRQSGWKIAVVADTYITHFNIDKDLQGWHLAEHRKGMLNYFCRYRPRWQASVLRIAIIIFHGLRWLFNIVFDRQRAAGDWMTIRIAFWRPKHDLEGLSSAV